MSACIRHCQCRSLLACSHCQHAPRQNCLVLSVSALWTELVTRQFCLVSTQFPVCSVSNILRITENLKIENWVETRQNCLVCNCVHTADTDSFVSSMSALWTSSQCLSEDVRLAQSLTTITCSAVGSSIHLHLLNIQRAAAEACTGYPVVTSHVTCLALADIVSVNWICICWIFKHCLLSAGGIQERADS